MINQLTYNGLRSYDDMQLIITETPALVLASRDVEYISVPGRSGDVLIDNGRYTNVEKKYKVALIADRTVFRHAAKKIAAWLNCPGGYYILTDTYDPYYYRHARYSGKLGIASILDQIGETTLTFNCKPFRYSILGQDPIKIMPEDEITNPEDQASEPYVKIAGSGDVQVIINDKTYMIYDVDGYIEIDSEIQCAHRGDVLQNNKIECSYFPTLEPGENKITVTGSVSEITVIPRWRAL